jgi:hypothetical protein
MSAPGLDPRAPEQRARIVVDEFALKLLAAEPRSAIAVLRSGPLVEHGLL